MTSDRSFSKSMRQDFRREIVWFILYCLAFLFAIPVAYLLGLDDYRAKGVLDAATQLRLHIELYQYTLQHLASGASAALLQIFALAEAYHSFGYLHRRTETDFVHSLPQTRKEIYLSHFVNGLKTVLVPYGIFSALGIVISLMTGLSVREVLWPCVLGILVNALLFVLTYALSANAVMLTGNAFTGVCGMLVLYFYFPAMGALIDSAMTSWFRTYVSEGNHVVRILEEITPFTSVSGLNMAITDGIIKNTFAPAYGAMGIRAAIVLAVTVLLIFTAYLLYMKRALECCGEAMAFPKTEGFIRNLLAVMAALAGMLFFYSIRSGLGWAEFGAVCAGVLSFLLIEMIYRRDIRRIFRHPWQLLLLTAGALVLTLALRNDWFRYDRYLPDRDGVVSVVYKDDRGGGNTGAEYVSTGREAWWAGDGRTEEMRGAQEAMTGKESIDAAYDFAKEGIERALKMRRGDDESVISYYYDNVTKPTAESVKPVEMEKALYTMSGTVTWHLASGRTVMRRYNVPIMQNLETIEALYRDETVKKQLFPVLALPDSIAGRIVYNELGYETPAAENAAQISEFLAAYRADASAATVEDLMEYPSALIMIYLTEEGDAAFTRTSRWVMEQMETTESFLCYPVYPSFTATREILKRYGITEGKAREAIMAEAVTEGRQWVVYEGASEIRPEGASGVIGPHEAEVLKDYIISTDYSEYGFSWMNPYLPMALEGVFVRHFDTDWEVLIAWTPETQALMEELLRSADADSRAAGQSGSRGVG